MPTLDPIPQKLRDIGAQCGYLLRYEPTRYEGAGWPRKSSKPFHIRYSDLTLCCAFATLKAMEKNLRGRCGC